MKSSTLRQITSSIVVALSIATSGCVTLDKSTAPISELSNIDARLASAIETIGTHQEQDKAIKATLQSLVSVPELDHYLVLALRQNPQLQQSMLALDIAYRQSTVTSAQQLPNVNAGFSSQRTEGVEQNDYTSNISVSWELDLWQKLNDQSRAAEFDVMTAEQEIAQVRNALVANVMRGWLTLALRTQLIDIEEQRLENQQQNLLLIESRYRSGLETLESLDNARASVSQTQATVSSYYQQKTEAQRSLNVLLGAFNAEIEVLDSTLAFPDVLMPTEIIGIQNLSNRPDVRATFFAIQAESLRTDVAYKALLPSISLSANLTDVASSPLSSLLTDPIWQILGQISAPLFQGGSLRAQPDIAEYTLAQQVWAYQDTLLTAVNEVENTLTQENALAAQQMHLEDAVASAQRSYASYREKYQQGLVDIFDLLNTQQQTFDLQSQLIQTTYNRLTNRIDMGLALGLGAS